MTLMDRIRTLRQAHSLSQKELAAKLDVSQNTVASYETGRTEPGVAMLAKLAIIFDVTTDYLIGVERPLSGQDADIIERFRALPPEDKIVAHKVISALGDREKTQSRKLSDG